MCLHPRRAGSAATGGEGAWGRGQGPKKQYTNTQGKQKCQSILFGGIGKPEPPHIICNKCIFLGRRAAESASRRRREPPTLIPRHMPSHPFSLLPPARVGSRHCMQCPTSGSACTRRHWHGNHTHRTSPSPHTAPPGQYIAVTIGVIFSVARLSPQLPRLLQHRIYPSNT